MKNHEDCGRGGFSLVECLALVLVMSMIGMTAGPTLFSMKQSVHREMSASNLRSIGQGGGLYANANQGRLFSYSWRAGETYVMPDGRVRTEGDDQRAAVRQNQEILQRRTGRLSGEFKIQVSWDRLPHRRFSHLVLMDFLNESLLSTRHIDPADTNQLVWHDNPLDYGNESSVPYASGNEPGYDDDVRWGINAVRQRWAFASSYQMVPSAWQMDYPQSRYIPIWSTPHLFTTNLNNGDPVDLHTGRFVHEVSLPGNKVWMFEEFDRQQVGEPYFGYDHARSEKLMFDGSVNSWASGESRAAYIPENGDSYPWGDPWLQKYVPLDTFPVPLGGLGDETLVHQRYRWTYGGLHGVDYAPGIPDREPGRR